MNDLEQYEVSMLRRDAEIDCRDDAIRNGTLPGTLVGLRDTSVVRVDRLTEDGDRFISVCGNHFAVRDIVKIYFD